MLHTKIRGNRSAGSLRRRCSKGFTIYGHGGHFGHVTSIILIYLHLHVPKVYIQNFVNNGQVVSEKSIFNFHM